MTRSTDAALWILAAAAIIAGLHWFRDILTQLALAVFLWLAIDGFARLLDQRVPGMPRWLALVIALILIVLGLGLVSAVIVENAASFVSSAPSYRARLDEILAQFHTQLNLSGKPPTIGGLLNEASPSAIVGDAAQALRALAGDALFILIYVGFLFAAQHSFPGKVLAIFPDPNDRAQADKIFNSIRQSMERYLWVQTISSIIISTLTYFSLLFIGLDNALFWAFLIFFLNYIPTIGSLLATALPTLFALVQFQSLGPVALTALGVGTWQFVIGNFIQPRMTGESLNLSTLVVLVGLAIWGQLWGAVGMFLSAPLTVMLMIVFAQFPSTYWIAVMLSADGKPVRHNAEPDLTG